ncbi:MAG TPA: cytochrome c peroxidase [Burkholderiales bacterium]
MRRAAFAILFFFVGSIVEAGEFPDVERAILLHGPWPPRLAADSSNAVSGSKAAIALGERLFFDPRLSGTGSVLCATCHVPYRGWQDGRARAFGLDETELNTPSLVNARFNRRFGWKATNENLWKQSIRPLLEPREMRSSAAHVARTVRTLYYKDYTAAFGREPGTNDEALLLDAGKALAAFQETLVSARTPFDDFRDALEKGDAEAASRYPVAARRGARVFVERCSGCHAGPEFSNGKIVSGYRVPGLRNVALTAPYMHDGSVPTLREAASHSSAIAQPQIDDLASFLESLTAQ